MLEIVMLALVAMVAVRIAKPLIVAWDDKRRRLPERAPISPAPPEAMSAARRVQRALILQAGNQSRSPHAG